MACVRTQYKRLVDRDSTAILMGIFNSVCTIFFQGFTRNKISPLPPVDENGSGFIQDDAGSKTTGTSLPSLRSDADITENENPTIESEQYGSSIIEILTKTTRLVAFKALFHISGQV